MKKAQVLLTSIFVIFAVCLILLISPIFIWQSVAVDRAQSHYIQLQRAQVLSAQVKAIFGGAEEQLRSITQVMTITEADRNEQERILSSLLSEDGLYEEVVLLDKAGEEQIHLSFQGTGPSTNSGNWTDTDAFVIPKTKNEIYYGPVLFNETTGDPSVVIGVPFSDVNNDNVLIATLRFKEVWDLVASTQLNIGENIYIVDGENRVVAHPNPSVVFQGTQFDVREEEEIYPGLNGVDAVVAAADRIQLGEQQLVIVSERSVSEVLTPTSGLIITLVIMGVVIIILVIVASLAFGVAYRFVKPGQEKIQ